MTSKIIFTAIFLGIGYMLTGLVIAIIKTRSGYPDPSDNKKSPDSKDDRVDPVLYDSDYYLHGYSGDLKEYLVHLDRLPISLNRCLDYADLKPNEKVLDLGCGRGELAYLCALKGCSVTAIDYSKDAIDLAMKTKQVLPENLRDKMTVKQMDFNDLDANEKFDVVVMADLVEHLYDWQLKLLFEKVKEILKPKTGRLVVHTAPNKNWINIIFPLKRIMDWPKTLRKGKDFYYKRDKYSYGTGMHVNEQTPESVKQLLREFSARVWCDDGSANIISVLTKGLAGADIWAIAGTD